jgi:hypothetical protein
VCDNRSNGQLHVAVLRTNMASLYLLLRSPTHYQHMDLRKLFRACCESTCSITEAAVYHVRCWRLQGSLLSSRPDADTGRIVPFTGIS